MAEQFSERSSTAQEFDNCRHCGHPSDIHNVLVGRGADKACNSMGCRCRCYAKPPTKLTRVLA